MSEDTSNTPINTINLLIFCATVVTVVFLICYYVAHCNGFNSDSIHPPVKLEKQ